MIEQEPNPIELGIQMRIKEMQEGCGLDRDFLTTLPQEMFLSDNMIDNTMKMFSNHKIQTYTERCMERGEQAILEASDVGKVAKIDDLVGEINNVIERGDKSALKELMQQVWELYEK
jgi:hypothetical protein